jgi:hypothetical protein
LNGASSVLAPLALTLCLAASPRAALDAVEKQEALNEELEVTFNAACSALKGGRRNLSPDLATADVTFPLDGVVQLTGCSLRALDVAPSLTDGQLPITLLWDLDGRDVDGKRVSVRGESPASVTKSGKSWLLSRLDPTGFERLTRDAPRFVERAEAAGLVFPERKIDKRPAETLSGGLTVRDLDGDGLPDVIALDGPLAWLYRGRPGLTFAKPELLATAPGETIFTSAATGDLDGDGDPDLALTTYRDRPVRLFRNDSGKFTEQKPLGRGGLHQSAIASDLDGDGKLDLVLLGYPLANRIPTTYLDADNGEVPEFWLGNGDFTFRRLSPKPGVLKRHWSFSAMAADLLHDGRMSVYVVNDYGVKDLYVLSKDGGVEERSQAVGLKDPGPGMSLDLGDVDRDGTLDAYVSNMFSKAGTRVMAHAAVDPAVKALIGKHVRGNSLFLAQPDGGFSEVAEAVGVNRGLWSFGSLLSDIDDDGRLEVLVANGFISAPNRHDH